tara:strand:- start:446 stop:694 length:249 start_codon:yes stop_codon:yes gene_type:complete
MFPKNTLIIIIILGLVMGICFLSKKKENFTGIGNVFSWHSDPQPKCNAKNNCFSGSYVTYGFGGNPKFIYDNRKRNFKMSLV